MKPPLIVSASSFGNRFLLLLRSVLIIVSVSLGFVSFGQYQFSVGGNYVHSFGDRSIELQSVSYNLDPTYGYEVSANNAYLFSETKLQAVLKVGFRQLFFSGSSDNLTYYGHVNKLFSSAGIRYRISEKIGIAGYIEAENNLALDEFNTGTGDLFRVCLSAEGSYQLTNRFQLNCLLSRAMTPITDAYLITNPQYQVRLGVAYTITP